MHALGIVTAGQILCKLDNQSSYDSFRGLVWTWDYEKMREEEEEVELVEGRHCCLCLLVSRVFKVNCK
jgi:hypothetical protein